MSIPTSPSRVSFHSIKQSTSLWEGTPAFVLHPYFGIKPLSVVVIVSCQITGLHFTRWRELESQGGRKEGKKVVHYVKISGETLHMRTLQVVLEERSVVQKVHVTKPPLEFGFECTAPHNYMFFHFCLLQPSCVVFLLAPAFLFVLMPLDCTELDWTGLWTPAGTGLWNCKGQGII